VTGCTKCLGSISHHQRQPVAAGAGWCSRTLSGRTVQLLVHFVPCCTLLPTDCCQLYTLQLDVSCSCMGKLSEVSVSAYTTATRRDARLCTLTRISHSSRSVASLHSLTSLPYPGARRIYRLGQKSQLLYCDRYFKGKTIVLTLNIINFVNSPGLQNWQH